MVMSVEERDVGPAEKLNWTTACARDSDDLKLTNTEFGMLALGPTWQRA
jgi:hypothetical protein